MSKMGNERFRERAFGRGNVQHASGLTHGGAKTRASIAGIEDAALEYAELDRKQQTASPAKACKRAAWPHDAISDSTISSKS